MGQTIDTVKNRLSKKEGTQLTKMKKRDISSNLIKTKDYKGLLWTIVCQQKKLDNLDKIPRKTQTPKTD